MSTMIDALVSDFGGVLTTPLEASFAAYSAEHGVPLEALGRAMADGARELAANPLFELETGRLSERDFFALLERGLERELGRAVPMHGFASWYFAHLQPNEELFAYLGGLRERGLRLALCTNNVREWEPLWRGMLPIDDVFEFVVDSAFVGMRKPDPEIYRLTLERLGTDPARTAFLDDMEHNVEAARALGLLGVRFASNAQAIAEIEALLA